MTNDRSDFYKWDPQLSEREVFFVGTIVVQWGSLEHEIFMQTLATFDSPDGQTAAPPKAMNNLRFTEVLSLWKERVLDTAKGRRAKVLQRQYDDIHHLKQYRDALAHGLWDWSATDLSRISTVRVKKKDVITTHFTADDLEHFASRLASINFRVRFPGGLADYARMRAKQGSYVSRRAIGMLTGVRQTEESFLESMQSKSIGRERHD